MASLPRSRRIGDQTSPAISRTSAATVTSDTVFNRHHSVDGRIAASADSVFDFLDDPMRLNDHMSRSSWMMGGGSMQLELDAGAGRKIGSRMTLRGSAFGLQLYLEEVVIERSVPSRKVWQTCGAPRLWLMADYRLGFEIEALADACQVRVFIDYALPTSGPGRWLGMIFGSAYAKWCTDRMLADARRHFARRSGMPLAARQ
jgi:hypothetical protein